MSVFKSLVGLACLALVLACPVFAQDKWVGKTLALPDGALFFYKLEDAALWSSLAGEDDIDTGHLVDFVAERGNQIKILESSFHGIAPDDKFYKAKILTGRAKGQTAWFDGYQLQSIKGKGSKTIPSAIPKSTYPTGNGH